MSIDPSGPRPIFQQIGDHIRHAVAAGVYRPGEAIPSLRAMALELQVNPNTVQRAYEVLEREGLIEGRKGVGMFVTRNGAAAAPEKVEAMVRNRFVEGIRVGRSSGIEHAGIRGLFEEAWTRTEQDRRRKR